MKIISKIIALSVRNNIETFHVNYLTDDQMKELNPLIRNGIYDALFALANHHKNAYCKEWVGFHLRRIPNYWEDPELKDDLKTIPDQTLSEAEIVFNSSFLNEQFKLGNLSYNVITGCIEIRPSFEFNEVPGNAHRHRDKISALLRKEEYVYIPGLNGYMRAYFS